MEETFLAIQYENECCEDGERPRVLGLKRTSYPESSIWIRKKSETASRRVTYFKSCCKHDRRTHSQIVVTRGTSNTMYRIRAVSFGKTVQAQDEHVKHFSPNWEPDVCDVARSAIRSQNVHTNPTQ